MNNIQRAIDKQAKLEAEATEGPWEASIDESSFDVSFACGPRHDVEDIEMTDDELEEAESEVQVRARADADLIAHLRNQAKLARDVIERAANFCNGREEGAPLSASEAYLIDALTVWADHVNGDSND